MRTTLLVLLALVPILGFACGGGGASTSPTGHTAGGIQGPQVINEGASFQGKSMMGEDEKTVTV